MSYCVNCGVELDASLKSCPLCNTPVVNPSDLEKLTPASPFPARAGQVETVKKKDWAVLTSIVLLSTALTCALLNLFAFRYGLWSLPIIGICAIVWVFAIPVLIYTRLPVYLYILFDGVIVAAYLYLITYMTSSFEWFPYIGLPITALVTALVEIIAFLCRHLPVSILSTALYVVVAAALLCIGIEIILDQYFQSFVSLSWSAVVLTVCTIISIALITVLSRKRLRNAVRKRLHF